MRLQTIAAFAALAVTPSLAFPSRPSWPHHHNSSSPHPGPPSYETPDLGFAKLYSLTTTFFDAFIYPANQAQTRAVNSTIFAANVLGRIDATRNFNGRELNTENIFGLFSGLGVTGNPDFFSLIGTPVSYEIVHFTANQNVVSVACIVEFEYAALGGIKSPLEIDVWMTYNADGQISQYDGTLRRVDYQFDYLLGVGQAALKLNSTAETVAEVTKLLARSICETEVLYCNGTNQQYDSFDTCYEFLTEEVPFGSTYQWGMNTLACRMVHQNMVVFRPDVHCAHIGKTGGGYCTNDMVYDTVVTQAIYANTPFVPYGYQNKNRTIAEMR